jgi:hypothetical protein
MPGLWRAWADVTTNADARTVNRLAFDATVHCLTGCAIGEVLGIVISTALGWHDAASIVLSIARWQPA